MTLITKPDFTYVWASGGAVVAPNDTKKQQGWVAEAPPFQYDNWLQNRQDQMLAHINQRGIPAWDGLTNYEAGGLSYVQGSDGKVYKSVAASGPASTAQDPTTDVTDTYWTIAFASTTQATETVQGIVELATQAEVNAGVLDDVAVTPKKLRWGFTISLAANGYICLPSWLGGVILQWGRVTAPLSNTNATSVAIAFPMAFPVSCYLVVAAPQGAGNTINGGTPSYGFSGAPSNNGTTVNLDMLNYTAINQDIPVVWWALGV